MFVITGAYEPVLLWTISRFVCLSVGYKYIHIKLLGRMGDAHFVFLKL